MREPNNIRAIEELGIDLMGFIFWEGSKRNNISIPAYLPVRCKRVGVFVNPMPQDVIRTIEQANLDAVQFHGHESPTLLANLRSTMAEMKPDLQIIKSISISTKEDIEKTKRFEEVADCFLFDTKCSSVGGSGEKFDWNILQEYTGEKPFILSGGIGTDDAERINAFKHPKFIGVDLNSRFETSPAIKDAASLKEFINTLRQKN